MTDKNQEFPYKMLGARLKGAREHLRETLAEVSGAVEIEIEALTAIEQGTNRPSEDILLLLISHFAIKEDEATKLWEMAGYDQSDTGSTNLANDTLGNINNAVMVMPMDIRIAYTDMAHIMINEHGVVLNFMQTAGPGNQPLVVSRLGMSREHAQSVLELLQQSLNQQEEATKALPAPETKTSKARKSDPK